MTFSEFAKMLYPYCGNGKRQSDFVVSLTDAILEEPKDDAESKEHNPVASYEIGTLEKIFNGNAKIGKQKATAVMQRIYKENFSEYINALSPDTLTALEVEVRNKGIDTESKNIGDVCADLLASIIDDIAKGKLIEKAIIPTINDLNKPFLTEIGTMSHIGHPNSDINLLMEANRKCPSCRTKPLVTDKGSNSLLQYKIIDILPVTPTEQDHMLFEELLDNPLDRNSFENKIPLCLDCANSYLALPTKEGCRNLIEVKSKLQRNYLAYQIVDDMYLETGIEEVLRGIANTPQDMLAEKLEYSALKIEKKIYDVALMAKAEGLALRYYQHIKGMFSLLEREKDLDFDDVAGNVKATYRRLRKQNLTQEEIFSHLTDWFLNKSQTNNATACEIVVAFFVQNCEVFDEIAE